jgi:hypothetical protein
MIAAGCSNGDVLLYDLRRAAVPCITVKAHHPLPVRYVPRKERGQGAGGRDKGVVWDRLPWRSERVGRRAAVGMTQPVRYLA